MKGFPLARPGERLKVLCLGAHSDDVEIGAGGTLTGWIDGGVRLEVVWCVLSAPGARAGEARGSAEAMLDGAAAARVVLGGFTDGLFPSELPDIKAFLAELRTVIPDPDVILTHRRDDAHQDHRAIAGLTTNLWRDHLVLRYEIPKWDGDLGRPQAYVPMSAAVMERKVAHLHAHFATQRGKDWFDAETFRGLARLRGMECRAPDRYAEAFFLEKIRL
jgi:LmbE family N-acetylglucosaminyl deacetylase